MCIFMRSILGDQAAWWKCGLREPCADIAVLVRVSVAAVAAGCGSAGAARTQGLMSTTAQVREKANDTPSARHCAATRTAERSETAVGYGNVKLRIPNNAAIPNL